jgi:hypothetical protein
VANCARSQQKANVVPFMEMQRTTTPISQQVNKELAWNWNGYFGSSFLLHMRVTTFLWNKKKHYEKFQQEKVDDASRMFLLCSFYKSAETTFFPSTKWTTHHACDAWTITGPWKQALWKSIIWTGS